MTQDKDHLAAAPDDEPPRRSAPKAVTTVEELDTLDAGLMVRGYLAGLVNNGDFSQRDKSYWHGFLNGLVDGGHAKATTEQAALARAFVAGRSAAASPDGTAK